MKLFLLFSVLLIGAIDGIIIPVPAPACPQYQHYDHCYNPCTEDKCPSFAPPPAPVCSPLCIGCCGACACDGGYYRNPQGGCVKLAQCPPLVPLLVCKLDCKPGYYCVIQNNKANCIPLPLTPPPLTCAHYPCPKGQHCYMVYPYMCPICPPHPQCLVVDPCRNKHCPPKQECVLVQVLCPRLPCIPIAECRAKKILPGR